MPAESKAEQRAWGLLTKNFDWEPPEGLGVKLKNAQGSTGKARLQIFEVAVAAVFARICPDYEWYVTPNLAGDGGVDFIGEQQFLKYETYGIAAAITVGGQCKKRQGKVGNVVQEIAGSVVNMMTVLDPTFFVVAFSAHLTSERIEQARERIELSCRRHCHILDRPQIEGLFVEHLAVLDQILAASDLSAREKREVREYFETLPATLHADAVSVQRPEHVLAGASFNVVVSVRSPSASAAQVRWRPRKDGDGVAEPVALIEATAADRGSMGLMADHPTDDPLRARCSLEFRTHAVGDVQLGDISLGRTTQEAGSGEDWIDLGSIRVIENLQPRFFELPFRPQLKRLAHQYRRAIGGGVASIGVVGAGGSGKSRLCEEFSLEQRRRGCAVLAAKQAKTLDDPYRVLVDLFLGLVEGKVSYEDPAGSVIDELSLYDTPLAERVQPAIRSIFATGEKRAGDTNEQDIVSALLLLIATTARRTPLIVHLQDLHWASTDVLLLLEKLIWQLNQVLSETSHATSGIFFIFEGRVRERQRLRGEGWDSKPFEAFLQKVNCPTAVCSSLRPEHSLEFVSRLFEGRASTRRLANEDLHELQRQLVERIDSTAGGNPFHSLEQVQLLKERGVVGQNPATGFLYLIRPEPTGFPLPDTVFESIQLRWQYLKERLPELALLVWALALIEDRVPGPLFRQLWGKLAPGVSRAELEATDLLWMGAEEREVSFRHENYFRALLQFEVEPQERERVVDAYCEWFAAIRNPDPADQFRWARVLLERVEPERVRAQRLLTAAARGAKRRGDLPLARRILTTSLDEAWQQDDRSPLRTPAFLRRCEEDLELARDLLGSDRSQAGERAAAVRTRIERRLSSGRVRSTEALLELQRQRLTAEVLESQHLFNDRRPARAAEIASKAVRGIEALRPRDASELDDSWESLEMDALYAHAVSLALSGEIDQALQKSDRAVEIARKAPSALGGHIICTHAAILLARDPMGAESIVREHLAELGDSPAAAIVRDEAEINLSMALILQAHAAGAAEGENASDLLGEARHYSTRVFTRCFELGQYPDAGAAALLLGIISAMSGDGDEVSWFAQAVAAASRGRHMETLWRAHLDLAVAMHRKGENVGDGVHDHAQAAVEIMEETLSSYAEPDESARFDLLRSPLAQATRYLLLAGDEEGLALLARYPNLRNSFEDVEEAILAEDRGGPHHYQWLRIGEEDYVLY